MAVTVNRPLFCPAGPISRAVRGIADMFSRSNYNEQVEVEEKVEKVEEEKVDTVYGGKSEEEQVDAVYGGKLEEEKVAVAHEGKVDTGGAKG
jgi:hypothetical protein